MEEVGWREYVPAGQFLKSSLERGFGIHEHMQQELSPNDLRALDSGGRACLDVLRRICLQDVLKWRPPEYRDSDCALHAKRHAFHVAQVLAHVGRKAIVYDIGGGWGHFSAACAQIGMTAVSVDQEPPKDGSDPRVMMSNEYGFELKIVDIVDGSLNLASESVDALVSFDCIEHLHHSPKKFYHEICDALKPGGFFFLGAPNCVNARKRLTVPLGKGKWSSMKNWYELPRFYDHVREPDVADFLYIAHDLKLSNVRLFGRNWQGYANRSKLVRAITPIVDFPLRIWPGLCADIYLTATKAG